MACGSGLLARTLSLREHEAILSGGRSSLRRVWIQTPFVDPLGWRWYHSSTSLPVGKMDKNFICWPDISLFDLTFYLQFHNFINLIIFMSVSNFLYWFIIRKYMQVVIHIIMRRMKAANTIYCPIINITGRVRPPLGSHCLVRLWSWQPAPSDTATPCVFAKLIIYV